MDDLLHAAKYIELPSSKKPKLINLKDVKKFIKCRNTVMSIIPLMNEELYRIIHLLKHSDNPVKTTEYIQEGHKILSKVRAFRPKLSLLSHKVQGIPKKELSIIKQLIYSEYNELQLIPYNHEQLDIMYLLYYEFKKLIKN
jgi:hypothetical protein